MGRGLSAYSLFSNKGFQGIPAETLKTGPYEKEINPSQGDRTAVKELDKLSNPSLRSGVLTRRTSHRLLQQRHATSLVSFSGEQPA